jgi:hypothetical protein
VSGERAREVASPAEKLEHVLAVGPEQRQRRLHEHRVPLPVRLLEHVGPGELDPRRRVTRPAPLAQHGVAHDRERHTLGAEHHSGQRRQRGEEHLRALARGGAQRRQLEERRAPAVVARPLERHLARLEARGGERRPHRLPEPVELGLEEVALAHLHRLVRAAPEEDEPPGAAIEVELGARAVPQR